MTRKIIHLDLDAFFCAVEELQNPSLHGKAFAVGGRPESRGVIASCSYAARQYGVHSAMPSARALRLCPSLILVPARHGVYGDFSRQVMQLLADLTPLVEQSSIDEAFMDVSDLPEPGMELARRLQATIHKTLGLPCSLGVATNKLVAKIATDVGKAAHRSAEPPNAITVVPPGEEAAFLAPLPAQALWGVGPKTAARLAELGIHTIGELARSNDATLASLFGQNGADMIRHARGIDDHSLETSHETKSISQETTFDQDLRDPESLKRTLREQSESVGRRLRASSLSGSTVRLKVRWSDFTTLTRQTRLAQPTDQDGIIFNSAIELFERAWQKGRPVRLLGVGVSGLTTAPRQLSLWDTNQEKEHRLLQAVDELRERFGSRVIQRADQVKPDKQELLVKSPQPPSSHSKQDHPITNAYWVMPGRILAGPFPAAPDEGEARSKLRRLLHAGITFFIDLTQPGEYNLLPYSPLLSEETARLKVNAHYLRLPIQDMRTPSREEMAQILESLSSAVQSGENVYLHCFGGRGRTGTVVGCYLVQQGMSPEQAL